MPSRFFCIFCSQVFQDLNIAKNHVQQHLDSHNSEDNCYTIKNSNRGKVWLDEFFDVQNKTLTCASSLTIVMKMGAVSYSDCSVCLKFRQHNPSIHFNASSRFHIQKSSFEEHLRFHLRYKSFFCHLCLDSKYGMMMGKTREFITTRSKATFDLERNPVSGKLLLEKKVNKKSIRGHLMKEHVGRKTLENHLTNKIIFTIDCFIGQETISALESFVMTSVESHQEKYSVIKDVKKSNQMQRKRKLKLTNNEIKSLLQEKKTKEVSKISVSKHRSIFNILPKQEANLTQVTSDIKRLGISIFSHLLPDPKTLSQNPVSKQRNQRGKSLVVPKPQLEYNLRSTNLPTIGRKGQKSSSSIKKRKKSGDYEIGQYIPAGFFANASSELYDIVCSASFKREAKEDDEDNIEIPAFEDDISMSEEPVFMSLAKELFLNQHPESC